MNFVYLKTLNSTPGAWNSNDKPGSATFTLLDQQLFSAPNFADGGTYAPSAPILVNKLHCPAGATWTLESGSPGGTLAVDNGGSIQVLSGGSIQWQAGATCEFQGSATCLIDLGGLFTCLGTGTLVGGGATFAASAGATISVSGGTTTFVTLSGGRYVLGDNDFPVLKTGHTSASRHIVQALVPAVAVGGSGLIQSYNVTNGIVLSNTAGNSVVAVPLAPPHNGANLTNARLRFVASVDYVGNSPPTPLPSLQLFRVDTTGGAAQSLNSGGAATYATPVSGTAYYNGGAVLHIDFAPDMGRGVGVSRENYTYYAVIAGDGLTGFQGTSMNYTTFISLDVTYDTIADMRFP